MLNILTNSNNNYLFDNNLISYALLLGSIGIVSYSMYYFSGYLNKTIVDTQNLTDQSTMSKLIVDNLESQSKGLTNLDNIVPKLSNYVEASVQTDDTMLYDYINGKLMENMTPSGTSLASHYSPSDYINEYNSNSHFKNYIDGISNWTDSVNRQSSSSFSSNSTGRLFLKNFKQDLDLVTERFRIHYENVDQLINEISPVESNSNSPLSNDICFNLLTDPYVQDTLLNVNTCIWAGGII